MPDTADEAGALAVPAAAGVGDRAGLRRKARLLFVLALLLFGLHAIGTFRAANAFNADPSVPTRFGPSFALALCSLPLMNLSVFNSIIVAIAIAAVVELLPVRAAAAILVAIPVLLLAIMIGAAAYLNWQTERGWRKLAPAPITPAPLGTLPVSVNLNGAIAEYLNNEIRSSGSQPLPQAADWFLVVHHADIAGLRQQLPWRSTSRQRYAMNQLLLVDALQTRSAEDVAAARRVTETLLHERRLEAASLAIAATHQRIVVARKLGLPREPLSFDPFGQLIAAIYAQSVDLRTLPAPWYAWPYAHLCVAETAYSAMRQARIIQDFRGMHFNMPKEQNPRPSVPWNPLGVLGNGGRLAWRANELANLEEHSSR